MADKKHTFTVFTKPWKMPLPELAVFVAKLGFDGVELPVRPGYQVVPERVSKDLPLAAKILADHGVTIGSLAGPIDEATIAACAEAKVPVIRICPSIPKNTNYFTAISDHRKQWDATTPFLHHYGVKIGIQNHCGWFIGSAMQVYHAIQGYDPRQIAAVWDPAHCALVGEPPPIALDILHDRLCILNLKNVMWSNSAGPEAMKPRWGIYWTSGRQGLADWEEVASLIKSRGWSGNICLCAEYSDEQSVNRLIADDLAYARACMA